MIALKAIHTSFTPTTHPLSQIRTRSTFHKTSLLCLSKPNDSDSGSGSDSDSSSSETKGDTQKQDLLARIAMLQTQKVRLTDYIDERSDFLTQFAEEATVEFDKIGEDALKDLDEASARIMENIEGQMQAFEESVDLSRTEIETTDNKVADFEDQMVKDLNEGMFFKNLGQQKPSVDKAKAKLETQKIKDITKAKAGSKTRKYIYLALMAVLAAVIAESFISSSADWRKVAVLGGILVGLITQFSYEQRLSSEVESIEKTDKENK
ncbi:uncharacterized protein [Euphorbia lathyris]|uniref:uncharacterized protein n=1 Tax=Euphorbia lathyris TaxID=212925 RepID=UPI003313CC36